MPRMVRCSPSTRRRSVAGAARRSRPRPEQQVRSAAGDGLAEVIGSAKRSSLLPAPLRAIRRRDPEFFQQRPRLDQVGESEALGEGRVDRSEPVRATGRAPRRIAAPASRTRAGGVSRRRITPRRYGRRTRAPPRRGRRPRPAPPASGRASEMHRVRKQDSGTHGPLRCEALRYQADALRDPPGLNRDPALITPRAQRNAVAVRFGQLCEFPRPVP